MQKLAVCLLIFALAQSARGDFAIRDGDTVVFLGDSITASRTYGKIIENYTLLRFPDRKVHFVNAGWGGDTAAGGLKRLQRDVFDHGATLLTVAYGINDIGWGAKADVEHRKLYLDSIKGIVDACKAHHVRVFICSAAATGADPDKSADDFLQKMCDEGMKISRGAGEGSIDVLRTMRECQRRMKASNAHLPADKKKETMHADDGIHLNDLGNVAMAYAILKGLGAPRLVSAATIDANTGKATTSTCKVSDVKSSSDHVEFTRLDEGLAFNQGLFFNLHYAFIPLPDEMNRYMLTVKNLKPGKYDIHVNDRGLGTFGADDLAKGVNIASATADGWVPGGPWDAQGWALNDLTEARNAVVNVDKLKNEYLKTNPNRDEIVKSVAEINAQIEQAQRAVAKPVPYHFIIQPAH